MSVSHSSLVCHDQDSLTALVRYYGECTTFFLFATEASNRKSLQRGTPTPTENFALGYSLRVPVRAGTHSHMVEIWGLGRPGEQGLKAKKLFLQ